MASKGQVKASKRQKTEQAEKILSVEFYDARSPMLVQGELLAIPVVEDENLTLSTEDFLAAKTSEAIALNQ